MNAQMAQEIADRVKEVGDKTDEMSSIVDRAGQEFIKLNDEMKISKSLTEGLARGIDTKEILDLADDIAEAAEESEDFADSLKHDKAAAIEVAKEIKRYDKAIENMNKNYDDWMKALGSDVIEDQGKAMSELRDTYADFLDLGDGSQLSDQFLSNAENLNLMKEAALGNVDAYNELSARAGQDILM